MSLNYELSLVCRCPAFRFNAAGCIVMDESVIVEQTSRCSVYLQAAGPAAAMIATGLLDPIMIPQNRKRKSAGDTWIVERTAGTWMTVHHWG